MNHTVDLHIHTNRSDGTLPPADVVRAALDAGLDVIALTDHDTMVGIPEALSAASGHPIEVIPAVEISTSWRGSGLHVLGYFVDPSHPELQAHGEAASTRREARMKEILARLGGQGIEVPFESVREAAAGARSIGRPHLARVMVDHGIVDSVHEAFDRHIGNDRPAYVPSELMDAGETIDLIDRAGGVSVWAHPPGHLVADLLPDLESAGLGGIEVYRPGAPVDRVRRLERLARSHGLAVSGGSDWHGPDGGSLGAFRVDVEKVEALLALG